MKKRIIGSAFAFLFLSLAGTTRAGMINYNAGASSFSFDGDVLTDNEFSGSINVPLGGLATASFQTGTFAGVNNGRLVASSSFTLTEAFEADGVFSTVALTGTLVITPPGDTLTFTNGIPTMIAIPEGLTLTVTPSALEVGPVIAGQTLPFELDATFQLSGVPEPSSLFLLGAGMLGLVAQCRTRRRA